MTKKRVVLSAAAVLMTLALVAGGTLAWFSDSERVNADFTAGVLDVNLTTNGEETRTNLSFENLRPMELAEFEKGITQTVVPENANKEGFGKDEPIYFRRVDVHNDGTLPMQLCFTMQDRGPQGDDVINIVEEDGRITQDGVVKCSDENYFLIEKLRVFVFENKGTEDAPKWVRRTDINLNTETEPSEGKHVYQPFSLSNPLPAGASAQFVVAAYLPEDADNRYQAKHYHASLVVKAGQSDEDAVMGEDQPPVVHSFSGKIKNAAGEPLQGYQVSIRNLDTDTAYSTEKTDEEGTFQVDLPAGKYRFYVYGQNDYKPVSETFQIDGDTTFDFILSPK